MPEFSSLASLTPYHVLRQAPILFSKPTANIQSSYGTLLGSSVYQNFIGGIVSFRALSRPQFAALQTSLIPIYFALQSAMPLVLALTYPGQHTSGLGAFLAPENRKGVLAPIMTVFAINATNLTVVGPATTRIMKERKHQETRDGKKSHDPAPHSKEMANLNKRFGRMHGLSALLSMISLGITAWYGVGLADRIV